MLRQNEGEDHMYLPPPGMLMGQLAKKGCRKINGWIATTLPKKKLLKNTG